MTTIRRYPPQVIEALLRWCEQNGASDPFGVLLLGLPYVHGLAARQIAAATFVRVGGAVGVSYPCARRAGEIVTAASAEIALVEPEWLAEAASHVEASNLARDSHTLVLPRSRAARTASVSHVRALVAKAGAAATGVRISCDALASTRAAEIADAGLMLALADLGYADSYWLRLFRAKQRVIVPRPVT